MGGEASFNADGKYKMAAKYLEFGKSVVFVCISWRCNKQLLLVFYRCVDFYIRQIMIILFLKCYMELRKIIYSNYIQGLSMNKVKTETMTTSK